MEAPSKFQDFPGVLNVSYEVGPFMKGNTVMVPTSIEGFRVAENVNRRSKLEPIGEGQPRYITRLHASLLNPIKDLNLQRSFYGEDGETITRCFIHSIEDDERFQEMFNEQTDWLRREQIANVTRFTIKDLAFKNCSTKGTKTQLHESNPRIVRVKIRPRNTHVLPELLGENALFIDEDNVTVGKGLVVDFDSTTGTVDVSKAWGVWPNSMCGRHLNVLFQPSELRHRMYASGAFEGALALRHQLLPFPVNGVHRSYIFKGEALKKLFSGDDPALITLDQQQRQAVMLMSQTKPSKTCYTVVGSRGTGKTFCIASFLHFFLKNNNKDMVVWAVFSTNDEVTDMLEWLLDPIRNTKDRSASLRAVCTDMRRNINSDIAAYMVAARSFKDTTKFNVLLGTHTSMSRLGITNEVHRRPPDVVVFDDPCSKRVDGMLASIYINGQPGNIVMVLNTSTPSPGLVTCSLEEDTYRLGVMEYLKIKEPHLNAFDMDHTVRLNTAYKTAPTYVTHVNQYLSASLGVSTRNQALNAERTFLQLIAGINDAAKVSLWSPIVYIDTERKNYKDFTVCCTREKEVTFKNRGEADVVVEVIKLLSKGHFADSSHVPIAVTSPFHGQLQCIFEVLNDKLGTKHGVRIASVEQLSTFRPSCLVLSLARAPKTSNPAIGPPPMKTVAADPSVRFAILTAPMAMLVIVGQRSCNVEEWEQQLRTAGEVPLETFTKDIAPEEIDLDNDSVYEMSD